MSRRRKAMPAVKPFGFVRADLVAQMHACDFDDDGHDARSEVERVRV